MTTYGEAIHMASLPIGSGRSMIKPAVSWSAGTITVIFIAACIPVLLARHIELLHDKRLGLLGKLQLALVTTLLLVAVYLSWLNYNAGHLQLLASLAHRI